MNLLIDSNIILDMVQRREPFSANSKEIIADCIKQKYQGFVSAHSLCDIYYILRKDLSVIQRLKLVEMFCQFFTEYRGFQKFICSCDIAIRFSSTKQVNR